MTAVDEGAGRGSATVSRSLKGQANRLLLPALVVVSVLCIVFSATVGASDASLLRLLEAVAGTPVDGARLERDRIILMELRFPRVIMGFLVGASLAVSGAVMQGLFRNPLADPGLTGVSSGASLGAVVAILLGDRLFGSMTSIVGPFAIPLAAFIGGLISTALLFHVATNGGRTSVAVMLLSGIALAAITGAATGFLIFLADDRQLRDLTFWGMGSLASTSWAKLAAALCIMLPGLAVAPFLANGLNRLALGEAAAFHMGIRIQRLKVVAIASVAAATGAAVALSGGIGFIGIVAPHLIRMAIGPDHRRLLPAAALAGGSLLVLADSASRTIAAPAELPIGILTAAAGGPFFLWILLKNRARLAN